jgi:NAD-specific glutamate dehydrogenase
MTTLRDLAHDALRSGDVFTPPAELVAHWLTANEHNVRRVREVFMEIRTGNVFDLTTLSVALRQLRNLVLVASAGH